MITRFLLLFYPPCITMIRFPGVISAPLCSCHCNWILHFSNCRKIWNLELPTLAFSSFLLGTWAKNLTLKGEYLILETDVFTYEMERENSSFLDLKRQKLQQKNRIRLEFQWKKGERDKSFYFSCWWVAGKLRKRGLGLTFAMVKNTMRQKLPNSFCNVTKTIF